ncbi:hypothetical protein Slin15195_G026800 [Septoria linicola]|uniref:Uncharacterized protein n=1 Tax=Septoria linicola TaxID=215465 RepID=A0A9Q9ARA7_9PEZI|nr:hypothetical protein Slin14017_G025870 [Septoria linicola]USW49361.1 hypothetical protein Slin15195_G026800 [Septoria linicola]
MAPSHHYRNFPPISLRDLTWADMEALTPLFRPIPMPHEPAYATWQTNLRSRIVDLPNHLRRKPDDPTAFCANHKNLNPGPIESLLNFFRHVLQPEKLKAYDLSGCTFNLLFDMSVTWGERSSRAFAPLFDVSYGRISAKFVEDDNSTCAACKLSSISDDTDGLAVLGALAISSTESKDWKVSKRVQFIESFYAAIVNSSGVLEEVTMPMWELALQLYRCRPQKPRHEPDEPNRSHVDALAAAAVAAAAEGGRSQHPMLVDSPNPFADDRAAPTPTQPHFQTPTAPRAASPYSQMDNWNSYRHSLTSPGSPSLGHANPYQHHSRAPTPSSIYSHGYGQTEYGSDESQIIDSYRYRRG